MTTVGPGFNHGLVLVSDDRDLAEAERLPPFAYLRPNFFGIHPGTALDALMLCHHRGDGLVDLRQRYLARHRAVAPGVERRERNLATELLAKLVPDLMERQA